MKTGKRPYLTLSVIGSISISFLLNSPSTAENYTVPDTDQQLCFDTLNVIVPPAPGEEFYGQDAQTTGLIPTYQNNGDGTVTDLNTGLMWMQALPPEKMTWDEAVDGADTCSIGGYNDWRLPDIKELYSLILFSGTDPGNPNPTNLIPFIDTDYFEFEYGDTLSGDRLIDAQYWSSTQYAGLTMNGDSTSFGVNFADGRIKGYPNELVGPPGQQFIKTSFVRYVRGNDYGDNQFIINSDNTVTDLATGLMWQQFDDGTTRNWLEALEYAENLTFAGHDDWRLPNAHELQSIVDYTRSLQETGSPAIDSVFECTQIIDEGGNLNYGFYWTGTTHQNALPGSDGTAAVYIAFGEALGWMMTPDSAYILMDVHGAGAQRSDPKCGDPAQYPHGHGPQGDVVRIYNLVRCVRNTDTGMEESPQEDEPASGLQLNVSSPMRGSAVFTYTLPASGQAELVIHDLCGRTIATLMSGHQPAGPGMINWESSIDPAGLYLCVLRTLDGTISCRLTILN